MKRANHLMPQIVQTHNLYLAFCKARKGKRDKTEVLAYEKHLNMEIQTLQNQLLSGKISIGDYRYFTIFDPKERIICAAAFRERVLQHALMNICHPVFERYQIADSYACRKNKGTYKAIQKAFQFNRKYQYFVKLDVKKYFETIPHQKLKDALQKRFKEPVLLGIFAQIIDSYHIENEKGLPIGNLCSQYFANHYLAVLDHYIKELLCIKPYLRYMDDFLLWSNDKEMLKKTCLQISNFVTTELQLVLKEPVLNHKSFGLPFLGYVLWQDKITLSKRSKNRFKRKISQLSLSLEREDISQQIFANHALPLLAFTQKASAKGFRKSVLSKWAFYP